MLQKQRVLHHMEELLDTLVSREWNIVSDREFLFESKAACLSMNLLDESDAPFLVQVALKACRTSGCPFLPVTVDQRSL